jgi:hypothetical protein
VCLYLPTAIGGLLAYSGGSPSKARGHVGLTWLVDSLLIDVGEAGERQSYVNPSMGPE